MACVQALSAFLGREGNEYPQLRAEQQQLWVRACHPEVLEGLRRHQPHATVPLLTQRENYPVGPEVSPELEAKRGKSVCWAQSQFHDACHLQVRLAPAGSFLFGWDRVVSAHAI